MTPIFAQARSDQMGIARVSVGSDTGPGGNWAQVGGQFMKEHFPWFIKADDSAMTSTLCA